jgi:hypothetical protein
VTGIRAFLVPPRRRRYMASHHLCSMRRRASFVEYAKAQDVLVG